MLSKLMGAGIKPDEVKTEAKVDVEDQLNNSTESLEDIMRET